MVWSADQVHKRSLDIPITIGLFLFALSVRVAYWVYRGTVLAADTSGYFGSCQLLQQDFAAALQTFVGIEYLGFTGPFCTFYILSNNLTGWIIIQVILSAFGCVLIYLTAKKIINRTAGIVAGGTLAILFDSFQWDVYILSDSIFVFAMTATLWAMASHCVHRTPRTRLFALSSLGYLAITRPFGIPILLTVVVADQFLSGLDLLPQVRGIAPLFVAVSGAVVLLSQRISWVLEHVTSSFATGLLVWNEPTLVYPFIPEGTVSIGYLLSNIHHIILIAILRTLVFFLPVMPRFSLVHNLTNIVTLVPVMLLAAIGVVRLSRRQKTEYLLMWLVPLIAILLVISVTFVDWDWRYRAPAGPLLAVLAGYTIGTDPRIARLRGRLKTEIQNRA